MYKSVFVEPGNNGWGVGFTLTPSDKKNKVVLVLRLGTASKIKCRKMKCFVRSLTAAGPRESAFIR